MKKIILTTLCFLSLSINAHSIQNAIQDEYDLLPDAGCFPNTWDDSDDTDNTYHSWEMSQIGFKIDPDILIRDPNWNKYDNENLGKDLF